MYDMKGWNFHGINLVGIYIYTVYIYIHTKVPDDPTGRSFQGFDSVCCTWSPFAKARTKWSYSHTAPIEALCKAAPKLLDR